MLCVWAVVAAALCAGARAQRPACARGHAGRCLAGEHYQSTYHFVVNGIDATYDFTEAGIFIMWCSHPINRSPSIALDDPALPRFEPALRVREVRLNDCCPRTASYAAALRAVNVIGLNAPSLGDAHAPQTYKIQLLLHKIENFDMQVLAAMPTLRDLTFDHTNVTTAYLTLLPVGLERLNLLYTGINLVPATVFARLPHLSELKVISRVLVVIETADNLSFLSVHSPATTLMNLTLPDTLKRLEVANWTPRRPEPWRSCAGLDTLVISKAAAELLPSGWLAHCEQLRILRVEESINLKLSPGALRGAASLEEVSFGRCRLAALPAGLLDDARALRVLDLQGNRLRTLPSELFRHTRLLSELRLSWNKLSRAALDELEQAPSLRELRLDHNLALDACPAVGAHPPAVTQEWSPLRNLTNLTRLSLAGTATRRLCASWRRLPRLQRLDISYTAITVLQHADLQFNTTVNITVVLSSAEISLRREDYESVATPPGGPTVTLLPREPLRCDCELYGAANALRLQGTRLREEGARCENERALRDTPLDELVCTATSRCPAGCACSARDRVLQVDCAGARLRRVPRVDPREMLSYAGEEPVELDLRLAGNAVDRLAPEDMRPELAALDLSNNQLHRIDAATMAALVSRPGRRVWLANNPLDCTCQAAAAALATVRKHRNMFRDWNDGICSDVKLQFSVEFQLLSCNDGSGSIQYTTPPTPQITSSGNTSGGVPHALQSVPEDVARGMSWGTVTALALGAAAVLVGGATALGWYCQRRRGLAGPLRFERRRPNSDEWAYDAFVSFAHADEAVVQELVERLEGGAEPFRLCVHYRDWMPGGWIPAQIAASVRVSRRTVAVVSEAFLRSKWARAEFREAYAAALEDTEPRLVLVLLEDPSRLPLDAELRAYVSGNTYVRWGDPWFWRKLRRALPAPSPRPTLVAAAASLTAALSPSPPFSETTITTCV